jgi:hypothetical protein
MPRRYALRATVGWRQTGIDDQAVTDIRARSSADVMS